MTKKITTITLIIIYALALAGCFGFGVVFYLTHVPWVDLSVLEHQVQGKPSIILDDEGIEWARFQLDRRQPINLTQAPKHLIDAFVTAEDHRFFTHNGISIKGMIRSLLINLIKGRKAQGASTITQQIVRLLYFDQKKTFTRKIKEQLLSIAIEKNYTKEHILEAYLNNLYFGCGIYGIEAASQRFWSKSISQISTPEAATLAAVISSPARYCPLLNPQNTFNRRNIILTSMLARGLISHDEHAAYIIEPITLASQENACIAPHAREHVRLFLEQTIRRYNVYTDGLIIQTSLKSSLQKQALKSFSENIVKLRKRLGKDDIEGSFVSIGTQEGDIKAIIGGYDFGKSQFDRAHQAYRQIGSIIKPLIFAIVVQESRGDFNDVEIDEPISFPDGKTCWNPQNYNKKYDGAMTLAQALSSSKNTIAVKALIKATIPDTLRYLPLLGITTKPDPYLTLSLGCVEAPSVEVAGMMNVFAHRGTYEKPHLILWVKDQSGKKIWKHKQIQRNVLSWSTASKVAQVLSLSFQRFKKRNPHAWKFDVDVIGKTGTTNDSRSCWFAGSTPSYTTIIYIGRDNNLSLGKDVYPSTTAFPIWLDYNSSIPQSIKSFDRDPTLKPVAINPFTGKLDSSPDSITILL